MSDVKPNNPAGRVHALLDSMRSIQGGTTAAGFASVFGVEKDDLGAIYRCLGEVAVTIDEVADSLRRSKNEAFESVFQKSAPRIKRAFHVTNFDQSWDQFKGGHVFEDDLRALEYCSAALSRDCPEPVLSEDQLQSLLARVNELYEEIFAAELDSNLKADILDGLHAIQVAIHDYKIRGSRGINEALKGVLVTAAVATKNVNGDENGDEKAHEKGVMQKFRQFVIDATSLMQLAKLLYPAFEHVQKLLTR